MLALSLLLVHCCLIPARDRSGASFTLQTPAVPAIPGPCRHPSSQTGGGESVQGQGSEGCFSSTALPQPHTQGIGCAPDPVAVPPHPWAPEDPLAVPGSDEQELHE